MKRHIPRDLTERLELPWILDMVLKIALKIVKWFNLYKYPFIHDPDKATVKRGVYGVWKSMHPVRNPIKGSGLKEYFAGQDYDYGALLLNYDKFKVKNEIEISAVGDLMNNLGIKY